MDPIVTVLALGDAERVIGSYGVMLTVAIVVGATMAIRAAQRARMDVGAVIALLGFVVGAGLLGSFVLYVVVEWIRTGTPMLALHRPGLVFFGAPLGAALAAWATARRLGVPLGRFADVAVPALPAAHAMGRIGCFLGGCCFGRPSDAWWAVIYTHPMAPAAHPSVARHPVPLYESAGLLLLALTFALVPAARVGAGRRLFAYLACYGVLRAVVEGFRGDEVRGFYLGGAVSTSQLISALLVFGAVMALWLTRPLPESRSAG